MIKIKKQYEFSKVGIDEVVGLKDAMLKLIKPIESAIQEKAYWLKDNSIIENSEYKSRDGFIAHSHNCGGLEINEIIPEFEQDKFPFLEYGEWDGTHYDCEDPTDCECMYAQDGEYDAKLRIWFKFEGYNPETNELNFYLYLGGGNGDAPYFRTKYEQTVFETEFSCKSIKGLNKASAKHIKKLLKIIK